jgi:hypothetical protein
MMKGLAVLVVLLSGCDLYFGGDDDPCAYNDYGGGKAEPAVAYELRNPDTGVCEYGGGGGGWCEDRCGACPPAQEPERDWGQCYGHCYGLGELACMNTTDCFAAYLDDPSGDRKVEFWGCWNTAPSGPVRGSCSNLGAYECSRHDDCKAIYTGYADSADSTGARFQSCNSEVTIQPSVCSTIDCGPGYTCEEECSSTNECKPVCMSSLTCAAVDCLPGHTCSTACSTSPSGKVTCGPLCVADGACEAQQTEAACLARMDCRPVYDGQDCTCYPDHCECKILTYERCE